MLPKKHMHSPISPRAVAEILPYYVQTKEKGLLTNLNPLQTESMQLLLLPAYLKMTVINLNAPLHACVHPARERRSSF